MYVANSRRSVAPISSRVLMARPDRHPSPAGGRRKQEPGAADAERLAAGIRRPRFRAGACSDAYYARFSGKIAPLTSTSLHRARPRRPRRLPAAVATNPGKASGVEGRALRNRCGLRPPPRHPRRRGTPPGRHVRAGFTSPPTRRRGSSAFQVGRRANGVEGRALRRCSGQRCETAAACVTSPAAAGRRRLGAQLSMALALRHSRAATL